MGKSRERGMQGSSDPISDTQGQTQPSCRDAHKCERGENLAPSSVSETRTDLGSARAAASSLHCGASLSHCPRATLGVAPNPRSLSTDLGRPWCWDLLCRPTGCLACPPAQEGLTPRHSLRGPFSRAQL